MSCLLRIFALTLSFILLILPNTCCKEKTFHDLFDLEYSKDVYKNITCEKIEQAKAYRDEYPFYAFDLLLESYKHLTLQRALNLSETYGKEDACLMLMDEASDKYSAIEKELKKLKLKTLPAHEWASIAFKSLEDASDTMKKASEKHAEGNFDASLVLFVEALTSLQKAEDFLLMAKNRNNGLQNISYETVSSKWIDISDELIKNIGGIGEARNALNKAKMYYQNESYYLALMEASRAKASIDYHLQHLEISNGSEALDAARSYLNYARLFILEIREKNDLDAPLAELNFELASLHLKDAEKQENDPAKIAIATLSMKEALIAKEQALAVLFLSKSHVKNHEMHSDKVNSLQPFLLVSFLAVIICISAALMLIRKKKK